MSAKDIPGWSTDVHPWLEWIAHCIPPNGVYLEVGVFLGSSLAVMGELRPDITLIAVDPWIETPKDGWDGMGIFTNICEEHGGMWMTFLHMMKTHAPDVLRRTRIVRGTQASVMLRDPVDMLFIDGAHDYENVRHDLHQFAGLVKAGGIISGHDYDPCWDNGGLVRAVDEYMKFCKYELRVGIPGTKVADKVWWTERPLYNLDDMDDPHP